MLISSFFKKHVRWGYREFSQPCVISRGAQFLEELGWIVGLATKITKIKINRDGRKPVVPDYQIIFYYIILSDLISYYIILYYHIVSMRRTSRFWGERRFHVFSRKRSDQHQAVGTLSAPNTGVHPESEEGQQGAILEDGIVTHGDTSQGLQETWNNYNWIILFAHEIWFLGDFPSI